jgi:hypothetical protein
MVAMANYPLCFHLAIYYLHMGLFIPYQNTLAFWKEKKWFGPLILIKMWSLTYVVCEVQFATLKAIINVCVILLLKMGKEKQSYTCENDFSISWKLPWFVFRFHYKFCDMKQNLVFRLLAFHQIDDQHQPSISFY